MFKDAHISEARPAAPAQRKLFAHTSAFRQVMVVSPHMDDAAFSLAATLRVLVAAGQMVRIVNCFTRTSFAPLPGGNERLNATTRRRYEEELFLRHLGANSWSDDLGLEDAPARTGLGLRAVVIQPSSFQDISITTVQLVERLEDVGNDTAVLAPLAIGNHPDHYIARQAALEKYRNLPIAFYEDLPYAASVSNERRAAAVSHTAAMFAGGLQMLLVHWPGDSSWKRECCSYYKSQISQTGIQKIINYMQNNNGEKLWCSDLFVNGWERLMAGPHSLVEQEQCLAEHS